jgi:parallel beta-helix repeat protein
MKARYGYTHKIFKNKLTLATAVMFACLGYSSVSLANHPVLVEGESDFDGDGRIGVDEDNDGLDQVFGTINAALGAANRGANQNGHVIIVTSGRFLEIVNITAANGDVTLQAAPGVEAEIEAVRAGDAAGNTQRQAAPGIIINAPSNRIVTIRNIVSRNWTEGILVSGNSRVIIDNCRVEHNKDYGIHVMGSAKATITNSQVVGSGFRNGAGIVNTPIPGIGIEFEGASSGVVASTTISGSFAAGIANATGNPQAVKIANTAVVFDNNPNFIGVRPPVGSFF